MKEDFGDGGEDKKGPSSEFFESEQEDNSLEDKHWAYDAVDDEPSSEHRSNPSIMQVHEPEDYRQNLDSTASTNNFSPPESLSSVPIAEQFISSDIANTESNASFLTRNVSSFDEESVVFTLVPPSSNSIPFLVPRIEPAPDLDTVVLSENTNSNINSTIPSLNTKPFRSTNNFITEDDSANSRVNDTGSSIDESSEIPPPPEQPVLDQDDTQGRDNTEEQPISLSDTINTQARPDTSIVQENQNIHIDVLANDTSADSELNIVSIDRITGGGSATIDNNVLIFNTSTDFDFLAEGDVTQSIVTYSIEDGQGTMSQSIVTITVTGTNDGPVASADTANLLQNATVAVDVLANDTDADSSDSLTLSQVEIDSGLGSVSIVNNELVYSSGTHYQSLAEGETAEVVVNYTATDESGATSQSSVTLTVTGTNDGPVANADTASLLQNSTTTIDVLANDTDADANDSLTLSQVEIDSGLGNVSIVNNELVYNSGTHYQSLAEGEASEVVVNYTATDQSGATSQSSVTLTVTGTNDGPVANADTASLLQNSTTTIDVLANDTDADANDSLTLSQVEIDSGLGNVSIVNNELVYNSGTHYQGLAEGETSEVVVNYTATDESGATSEASVTLTVTGTNDGPVANADTANLLQNATVAVDVLANDTDVDTNHSLTLSQVEIDSGLGSVSIVNNELVYNSGTHYQSLAEGETSEVVVNYTVTDESGATSQSSITLTVTGTNDGPIANADTANLLQNATVAVDVLANDTDVDTNHSLTLSQVEIDSGLGSVSIVNNELVYNSGTHYQSLAEGETAEVVVNYTATDESGASSQSSVTLTVTGTNDGPIANADTANLLQNATVAVDVLANDTDADASDSLTLSQVEIDSGLGSVSIVNNELVYNSGTHYQSLAEGESAEVVVNYIATDESGATSQSSVTLTVTGTNDGPVANADTANLLQNATVAVDVLANDTDADASDSFTLSQVEIDSGLGSVSIVNNELVYNSGTHYQGLAEGETSEVVVSYTATDESGATSQSSVTLTVTGTNDGPVANADTTNLLQNATTTVDVLANDTDADSNDSLTLSQVEIDSGLGSVSIVNNELVYNSGTHYQGLAEGETAEVVVNYTATDESGATSQSSVTLTVTGTNDGPIANADTANLLQNATVAVDVLANDTDVDTNHSLTLSQVEIDSGLGSVSIVNNELVYNSGTHYQSLAEGETAEVVVNYTATDESGATSQSNVTLTVTGTNDGPVASADTANLLQNATAAVDVLANDTDADSNDSLTLSQVEIDSGLGSVSIVNNELVYNSGTHYQGLAEGETSEVVVNYTVTDESGATSQSNVTLTVTGTNDGPVASTDTANLLQNATAAVDVLANDTDADSNDSLTLSQVEIDSGLGSVSIVNNELVYNSGTHYQSLAEGETSEVVVNYTAIDESGASSQSSVTLTVTGTNDGPVANADAVTLSYSDQLSIDLLANDTDIDASDNAYIQSVNVSGIDGSMTISNNELFFDTQGAWNYLRPTETSSASVEYTMVDDGGLTSSSTLVLTINGWNNTIVGTEHSDLIVNLSGRSRIFAGGGDDTIRYESNDGYDYIDGGEGQDTAELTLTNGEHVLVEDSQSFNVRTGENFEDGLIIVSNDFGILAELSNIEYLTISASDSNSVTIRGDFSHTDLVNNGITIESNLTDPLVDASGIVSSHGISFVGAGGNAAVNGSINQDIMTGGADDDQLMGGAGIDQFVYHIGDGVDRINGGVDSDTLTIESDGLHIILIETADIYNLRTGSSYSDEYIIVSVDGQLVIETTQVETIIVESSEDDHITIVGDFSTTSLTGDIQILGNEHSTHIDASGITSDHGITFESTSGVQTIFGSAEADAIVTGDGDDIIIAGQGADTIITGAGSDTVTYVAGDGVDAILCGEGVDQVIVDATSAQVVLIEDAAQYLLRTGEEHIDGELLITIDGELSLIGESIELFELTISSDTDTILSGNLTTAGLNNDGLTVNVIDNGQAQINVANLTATLDIAQTQGQGILLLGDDQDNVIVSSGEQQHIVAGLGNDLITTTGADTLFYTLGDGLDTIHCPDSTATLVLNAIGAETVLIEDAAEYFLRTGDATNENFIITIDGDVAIMGNSLDVIDITVSSTTSTLLSGNLNAVGLPQDFLILTTDDGQDARLDVSELNASITPSSHNASGFIVIGGSENDIIYGSDYSDTIDAKNGDDQVLAGHGNDTVNYVYGEGVNYLMGGEGDDKLVADLSEASIVVIEDTASFIDRTGDSVEQGDFVVSVDGEAIIFGESFSLFELTVGINTTALFSGDLELAGFDAAGIDVGTDQGTVPNINVSALSSNHIIGDLLDTGLHLVGGSNGSLLEGAKGDDIITGGIGNDTLIGHEGNDEFYVNLGKDTVNGGLGDDLLHMTLLSGENQYDGGVGWFDTVSIDSGAVSIANLTINGESIGVNVLSDGMDLLADSSGTINLLDGSQTTFTNIERLDW